MTQATKGTFLQLPSVFIETCDLPETAQIMYIRMLHNFGYKGIYTGSLRKLANLVRMSKSTVDRMLNVLSTAHLISRGNTEASETAQSILQISLDPEYLWHANIDYCTTQTVPNWDKRKQEDGECPKIGQSVPPVGQPVPKMGQSVPTRTLKQAPNITKTNKTSKDTHVTSAHAESDGGTAFLAKIPSFGAALEEVRQQENGQAPLNLSASPKEEVRPEGLPRVIPEPITDEPTQPSTEPPTQSALLPALQGKPTSPEDAKNTPSPTKTVEQGKHKIPEAKPLCSPRIIREAIDAIRGHALEEAGAMIHQNKVLKEWCQKHTLEDYQRVIEHITKGYCSNKEHQFWREGTNFSSFFNADKLAKLTPGILACVGHIPKPNAPPEVAPKEEPKFIGWQPQRRITPPRGVTVTYA